MLVYHFNRHIVKRILFVSCVLFSLFVIALHIAVNSKGKQFVSGKLTKIFNRPVTIGKLNTHFFVNVYLEDVTIEGLCRIDKVFAVGGIFDVFRKNINLALLKIVHPVVTVDGETLASLAASINPSPKNNEVESHREQPAVPGVFPQESKRPSPGPVGFTIHQLIINDGELTYTDTAKATSLRLERVYVKMGGLQFTARGLGKFFCQAKGVFSGKQSKEGVFAVDGWVDYPRRNMDIDLTLRQLDYRIFAAYYPSFWKPDNLGVRDAYLSLAANLNSRHNNLLIDASLTLDDIFFVEGLEDNSKIRYLKTIIAIIQGEQAKPTLSLKINTLMDAPQLDLSQFKNNFKGMIKFRPTMAVEQAVEKTREIGVSALKGTKEVAVDNAIGAVKGVVGAMRDAVQIPGADAPAGAALPANGTLGSSGQEPPRS